MIYSSVVGHMGCFQSLAIVNRSTMNIGAQVSLLYPVLHFLGRNTGAVSLDHMAVLPLVFWGISILFSIMVVLICIPTSCGSCFPTSLPAFVVIILDSGQSNWGEMRSKCCFDLHLFYNQGIRTLLHAFTGHLYLFLWEFPVEFTCLFRHWSVDCLEAEFFEFPIDSGH
jgi:hypothetical protein